jgi:hypothetical protein
MSERPTTVALPGGKVVDAVEVPIEESHERWSELKLEDGAILRVKMTVLSVNRVQGMWDQQGNPFYMVNMSPVMAVVEAPEHLRKKVN